MSSAELRVAEEVRRIESPQAALRPYFLLIWSKIQNFRGKIYKLYTELLKDIFEQIN